MARARAGNAGVFPAFGDVRRATKSVPAESDAGACGLRVPLLVFLLLQPAGPATADAVQACNQFGNPASQIRGCTEYIGRGAVLPENLAVAYTNRAIAYASTGDRKRGLADFREAIRLAPGSPFPYYNRGNLYYDLRDFAHALEDYNAAIARDPELALAYYNRGLTHQKLGNRSKSIEDFEKALALDPGSQAARKQLHKLGITR